MRRELWADAADALHGARADAPAESDSADVLLEAWAFYRDGRYASADQALAALDITDQPPGVQGAAIFLRAKLLREQGRPAEAAALLEDPALEAERAFWTGLAADETAELVWYRKMTELSGVSGAFDSDAASSSAPSAL